MVTDDLDISIEMKHVTFSGRQKPLAMQNYFLIHRWMAGDLSYALCSEQELWTITRYFWHPSTRATEGLIWRALGVTMATHEGRCI